MRLHSLRPVDIEHLVSWLPDVATAAECQPWADSTALAELTGKPGVLTNDARTAFLAYELRSPEANAARVTFLAVAPDERRLGIGGQAALAVERRLRGKAKRLYVVVPSSIGLALYFWLRLGYKPLERANWPEPPANPPAVWMVQEL